MASEHHLRISYDFIRLSEFVTFASVPKRTDFDHRRGPLGHSYYFEQKPEKHNDLVRLLKGWARTHVKVPGILLEVVAKEVSGGFAYCI